MYTQSGCQIQIPYKNKTIIQQLQLIVIETHIDLIKIQGAREIPGLLKTKSRIIMSL